MVSGLIIHHFGGLGTDNNAKTSHLTEAHIENAHRQRFNMRSSLGSYIGYGVIIYPDGKWKQYRKIGEEQMAQKGWNISAYSICLAGNFNVEKPTQGQIDSLRTILRALIAQNPASVKLQVMDTFYFTKSKIYPHRAIAPKGHTACYGTSLKDSWARDLVNPYKEDVLEAYKMKLRLLIELLKQLVGVYQRQLQGEDFDHTDVDL